MKTIEFVTLTDENGASAQVLPVASTEGYEAEIKLPNMNRTFNWNLSEGTDLLKQGMRYICTVRVDLDKIEVKTESEPIDREVRMKEVRLKIGYKILLRNCR